MVFIHNIQSKSMASFSCVVLKQWDFTSCPLFNYFFKQTECRIGMYKLPKVQSALTESVKRRCGRGNGVVSAPVHPFAPSTNSI